MKDPLLHALAAAGKVARVRDYLADPAQRQEGDINARDRSGYTPLMRAVTSSAAGVETVRTLLDHGADMAQETDREHSVQQGVMALALAAGDPAKVRLLIERGGDIHYQAAEGYGALVNAVHGRDVWGDDRLLDLLRLLIAEGVDLNAVTSYRESGSRVLSRVGRFDAVGLLLDAGADARALEWTPLMRAVTLGSAEDVKAQLDGGAELEARDWWSRTPFLLAVQTGDLDKARLLQARGADIRARGRCDKPPLFYAVQSRQMPMLRWLREQGADLEERDEFGDTPLMHAASEGNAEATQELLHAGARVDADKEHDQTALSYAEDGAVARLLLDAGADPRRLTYEARRALLGLPPEPDETLLTVSAEEFQAGRARRFGNANPEKVDVAFWEGMIRAGITGYSAIGEFEEGEVSFRREPVWCAQRFGQTITFLPDGRIIQVAGEHEDHYDPDFCIYNDVFVHQPDGRIEIYAYPEAVFPPTDFHTATLLGDDLYLIGSLGYQGQRQFGRTPVYRLDTRTLAMEAVETRGDLPGWIYEHQAVALSADTVRVSGGKVAAMAGGEETHHGNDRAFVLQVREGVWTAAG